MYFVPANRGGRRGVDTVGSTESECVATQNNLQRGHRSKLQTPQSAIADSSPCSSSGAFVAVADCVPADRRAFESLLPIVSLRTGAGDRTSDLHNELFCDTIESYEVKYASFCCVGIAAKSKG